MDEDVALERIEIYGPTLTSLIQRVSSSPSDVDGLLFGQINRIVSSTLTDDESSTSSSTDQIIATVTSFITSGKTLSFYDPNGKINQRQLRVDSPDRLLGWFSSRRKTANRPSMRESAVTSSLSNRNSSSSVFILLTTPLTDQVIHTHEYRAYQYRTSKNRLESRSVKIVNIGPDFRGHYGSFTPQSGFPMTVYELQSSAMVVDCDESSLSAKKQSAKDQKDVDELADGLRVGSLRRLVGVEAANYTGGVEGMYETMLDKVESLVLEVELSSARVYEQECRNRKMRYRAARIER